MTISPPAATTAAAIASGRIPRTATTRTTFKTVPPSIGRIITGREAVAIVADVAGKDAGYPAETATRQGLSR